MNQNQPMNQDQLMNQTHTGQAPEAGSVRASAGSRVMWLAGLVVALGAGVLTAHGLVEVALGSGVPTGIGWLYPVITDGLALVAYAATTRLTRGGRAYACSVVVLAAGLSALAQACYLAGGMQAASPRLRFTVGAWPAVAAAIAAHLLYLIGTTRRPNDDHTDLATSAPIDIHTVPVDHRNGVDRGRAHPSHHPLGRGVRVGVQGVQADQPGVQPWDTPTTGDDHAPGQMVSRSAPWSGLRPALSPSDRALAMAELHRRRSGSLPSVRELARFAEVSRGTAETVLRHLRTHTTNLHVVTDQPEPSTES